MARYTGQVTSAAGLAAGTAFAWLGYSAAASLRLRRVMLGTVAGSSPVPSQQLQVGINITSSGTPVSPAGTSVTRLNPAYPPALASLVTSWGTPPALASADAVCVAFNSLGGGDWPWEIPEDFWLPAAPASNAGFAFVNRANTLPAGTSLVLTVEWEE